MKERKLPPRPIRSFLLERTSDDRRFLLSVRLCLSLSAVRRRIKRCESGPRRGSPGWPDYPAAPSTRCTHACAPRTSTWCPSPQLPCYRRLRLAAVARPSSSWAWAWSAWLSSRRCSTSTRTPGGTSSGHAAKRAISRTIASASPNTFSTGTSATSTSTRRRGTPTSCLSASHLARASGLPSSIRFTRTSSPRAATCTSACESARDLTSSCS